MRFFRLAALAAAAFFSIAATHPHPNWTGTVTVTKSGSHILGNPNAKLKLTEYISYTCPHCANFFKQSNAALQIVYVLPGKVSVEVRHLLRDPVDLTVAMLTNCGDPHRFFANNSIFLTRQSSWIKEVGEATKAQKERWFHGPIPQRLRDIASDFGFYRIMEERGYDRVTVNRCLADKTMLKTLTAQTEAAEKQGINATPTFALNGVVLAGTHDWEFFLTQLQARM